MLHGRGLVVEQDRKFTGILQDEEGLPLPLSFASTLKQALILLKSEDAHISITFISTSVPPAHGIEAVKEVRSLRPSMPIILIDHYENHRVSDAQAAELGCLAVVRAPKSAKEMLRPLLQRLETQNSWQNVEASEEQKDVTLDVKEEDFLPIPMSDFVFTTKSFFNIFIRLGKGKLVKVLNAGDSVDPLFIGKYIEKGIKQLYIKEEEQQRYINFCDMLVKETIRKSGDLDEKTARIIHMGENVKQGLYQSGITPERLHFADNFLQHSAQLARGVRRDEEKLSSLIDSLLNKDHVTTVVMLSGLLAQQLGFESKKAVQMVGMSALFHDIGLYDLMPDLKHEDPAELSREQKAIWNRHPERGVEILRQMGGFDEVVYQAVEQHHLRKRGDVSRKIALQINMVSEIIGIVDDFQNVVLTGEYSSEKMALFEKEYMPLFSLSVVEAFKIILKATGK